MRNSMPIKGKRARIEHTDELQICAYSLEFRTMQRTKLAEKIQNEVRWQGKSPEIEVLERKISHYRKQEIDGPEDKAWSMATIDKHPIPPQAIPAVLACQKLCFKDKVVLTIREVKWVSRFYALMADEVRQDFVWRHGVKWLDTEPLPLSGTETPDQSSQHDTRTEGRIPLRLEEGDWGALECPKCKAAICIGPTSQRAICVGCKGQFDIVRISVGSDQSDAIRKGTSITRNIPPLLKDVRDLYRNAKAYAHLEMLYDLIGQPFDSTLMDRLLIHAGIWIPNLDEPDSWLPYLAFGIEDFQEFKEKARRAIEDERAHNKEG
jgi:hypothetical protein